MDKKIIGRAIRKRRLQLCHTQKDVADAAGVKPSYVARIESGKANFTIDKLLKIAKFLDLPVYSFFHARPLSPYTEKPPQLIFNAPQGDYEGIKLFADPVILGPGYAISELIPADYAPLQKEFLPPGAAEDRDRVVAFPARDNFMAPTITKGSLFWVDRKDTEPKVGHVYAFLLKDENNAVVIRRLAHIDQHFLIIDADGRTERERSSELKDYPRVLNVKDYEHKGLEPIRGRVIWVLNRMPRS